MDESGNAVFTVSLSNPIDIDVDVDVDYTDGTTIASDFDHTPDIATFTALTTAAQQVVVAITDDNIVEATENFAAALSTATARADRSFDLSDGGAGTIIDNDTAVFSIDDVTVDEAAGNAVFSVSVSNPIDIPVDVDVTYSDGSTLSGDFDHGTDLASFAALSTTTQQVTVAITDDNLVEATENFVAALSTATALADRSLDLTDGAMGTITDNDTAFFTIEDVTVNEGMELRP